MLEKDVRDFFFKTKENYNLIAGQKEFNIDGLRIDIFAVDKQNNPFIIEFKKDKNRHIVGQSAHYLALIPGKYQDIEKKLNYYNINWTNLKVLCIAKSFNQRDFDALKFEPIKNRVFLYQYNVVKDYRQKAIFGLDLVFTGSKRSPLYLPTKPTNKNFIKHFEKHASMEGKETRRQYYTNFILPLLKKVSATLAERYSAQGLYPHISYFNKIFMLRLGPDKKQSHRASIAVTFDNSIRSGFDLTHALPDGQALKGTIKQKLNKIALRLLALDDYTIYIPNTGIGESISIKNLDLKGMTLLLKNYDPQAMRECYFTIDRWYEKDTLTETDILEMFETEYQTFSFLLNEITNRRQ